MMSILLRAELMESRTTTTNGMRIKYVEVSEDAKMLESVLRKLDELTSQIEILSEYLKKVKK